MLTLISSTASLSELSTTTIKASVPSKYSLGKSLQALQASILPTSHTCVHTSGNKACENRNQTIIETAIQQFLINVLKPSLIDEAFQNFTKSQFKWCWSQWLGVLAADLIPDPWWAVCQQLIFFCRDNEDIAVIRSRSYAMKLFFTHWYLPCVLGKCFQIWVQYCKPHWLRVQHT